MKSTGMIRKVDELGRIVIPIEIRRTMNIKENDSLEIFIDGNRIIFQKYERGCCFCGEYHDDMISHGGKLICPACIEKLHKQVHLDARMKQATTRGASR